MKWLRYGPFARSAKYRPSESATEAGIGEFWQYMEPEVSTMASAFSSVAKSSSAAQVALSASFSSSEIERMKLLPRYQVHSRYGSTSS